MKKMILTCVLVLLLMISAGVIAQSDNITQETMISTSLLLADFFNIQQGWQDDQSVFAVDCDVSKLWDDKTRAILWLRPKSEHTGFGIGLGYKDYPVSKSKNADNLLLAVSLQANTNLAGCQLNLVDQLYWRCLGRFAPTDKLETNNLEMRMAKRLAPFNFSATYGLKNWRPYDGNVVGITAWRLLRLGIPFAVASSTMEFGYQAQSQRFASEHSAQRLRSWPGVYWLWSVNDCLFLDLAYGFGQMEQSGFVKVKKTDEHQINFGLWLVINNKKGGK